MGDNTPSFNVSVNSQDMTAAINQLFDSGAAAANIGVGANYGYDTGIGLGYNVNAEVPISPYGNMFLNGAHSGGSSNVFGRQSEVGLRVQPTPAFGIGASTSTNGCTNVGATWNVGDMNMSAGGFHCGGGDHGASFSVKFHF